MSTSDDAPRFDFESIIWLIDSTDFWKETILDFSCARLIFCETTNASFDGRWSDCRHHTKNMLHAIEGKRKSGWLHPFSHLTTYSVLYRPGSKGSSVCDCNNRRWEHTNLYLPGNQSFGCCWPCSMASSSPLGSTFALHSCQPNIFPPQNINGRSECIEGSI